MSSLGRRSSIYKIVCIYVFSLSNVSATWEPHYQCFVCSDSPKPYNKYSLPGKAEVTNKPYSVLCQTGVKEHLCRSAQSRPLQGVGRARGGGQILPDKDIKPIFVQLFLKVFLVTNLDGDKQTVPATTSCQFATLCPHYVHQKDVPTEIKGDDSYLNRCARCCHRASILSVARVSRQDGAVHAITESLAAFIIITIVHHVSLRGELL